MNQYYPIISIAGLNPHAKIAQSQQSPSIAYFQIANLLQ